MPIGSVAAQGRPSTIARQARHPFGAVLEIAPADCKISAPQDLALPSTPKALLKSRAMKIRWKIDLAISGAFLVGLGLAGVGA